MKTAVYNKIVDDYSDGLFRFALKMCKDEELSRDLLQDTFEKLWLHRNDIDVNKAKSYLFTSLYHVLVDVSRKNKRAPKAGDEALMNLNYTSEYTNLTDVLHEALNRLPEIQKTLVLLRDYEGYSYEEIGEITSLTEAQVKVYIFRARLALKKFIGSMDLVI
jgi:RNA polymerase sigma factor (sigma-70 family)